MNEDAFYWLEEEHEIHYLVVFQSSSNEEGFLQPVWEPLRHKDLRPEIDPPPIGTGRTAILSIRGGNLKIKPSLRARPYGRSMIKLLERTAVTRWEAAGSVQQRPKEIVGIRQPSIFRCK